jgi:hypothetical protein
MRVKPATNPKETLSCKRYHPCLYTMESMFLQKTKFIWEWDETTDFLSPRDAIIFNDLIDRIEFKRKNFCEIGVWKGAFIKNFLTNNLDWEATGVDPWPGFEKEKTICQRNLEHADLKHLVKLVDSTQQIPLNDTFDFFHIDGEHTESSLTNDLNFALSRLSSNGFIAVDDIFHFDFPGIASATFKFIHEHCLSPFLFTGGKIFICREKEYLTFHNVTIELLKTRKIEFNLGFKDEGNLNQVNSIRGYQQIMVNLSEDSYEIFRKNNNIPRSPYMRRIFILGLIKMLIPAIIYRLPKYILHKLRNSITKKN